MTGFLAAFRRARGTYLGGQEGQALSHRPTAWAGAQGARPSARLTALARARATGLNRSGRRQRMQAPVADLLAVDHQDAIGPHRLTLVLHSGTGRIMNPLEKCCAVTSCNSLSGASGHPKVTSRS